MLRRRSSRLAGRNCRRVLLTELLEPRRLLAGDLAISELMAINETTIADEDGEFSDWIELRNVGDAALDVGGWHLSDDPADPTRWTLPSATLAPGDHLLVFASGKDRSAADAPWHTNFTLPISGGYVGLFQPGGSVLANQFGPDYPHQAADVSFGIAPQAVETTLVATGATANVLVPSSAADLPADWNTVGFDDSAWPGAAAGTSGPTGIGFEAADAPASYPEQVLSDGPIHYYRFEESDTSESAVDEVGAADGTFSGNVAVGQASAFDALGSAARFDGTAGTYVELPVFHPGDTVTVEAWVNFSASAPSSGFAAIVARWDGSYELDVNIGANRANFVTKNTSNGFASAESGEPFSREEWHHVVGIFENGLTTVYVDAQQGTVDDTSASGTTLRNAGARLFIGATRNGDFRWNGLIDEVAIYDRALTADDIREHFESAAGGVGTSIRDEIQTDIESLMYQQNASAAVRVPLMVNEPAELDALTLKLKYDDGFVAYLNGTEVARDHAPMGVPAWNASATAQRSNVSAVQFSEFEVTPFISQLEPGHNVLAIHGLNFAADDSDFLVAPELVALQQDVVDPDLPGLYLDVATPGADNTDGSAGVRNVDGVTINELSAMNRTILDEDGEDSDWLELFNPLPYAVDLNNAYLTDDDGDLTGWRFTRDSIIPARGFLVVFASGKDRKQGELHTDFRLAGDGQFLALVKPDGQTIVSLFAPFPAQFPDVSYGIANEVQETTLLDAGDPATVLVPREAADIPADWTAADFDDSSWAGLTHGVAGPLPVGFGLPAVPIPGPDPIMADPELAFSEELVLIETGHRLQYEADPDGGTPATAGLSNLALASNSGIGFASSSLSPSSFGANRINDGGYGQGSVGDDANPWVASSSDTTGFVGVQLAAPQTLNMIAMGTRLPTRGDGLFSLQYTITSFEGVDVNDRTQIDALSWNTIGTINSSEPDEWERHLVGFQPIDDVTGVRVTITEAGTAISEMEAYNAPVDSLVATDIASQMSNQAPTALVRVPFTVDDPGAVDQLLLEIQYDDAFVAYINGIEVARRNVTGTVVFDTVADSAHPPTTIESIDVSSVVESIAEGPEANVLAIHGLNVSTTDADFFVSARLAALSIASLPDIERYFLVPSPGAANGRATEDRGPVIRDVRHSPSDVPSEDEDLVVTARIDELGTPLGALNLHYRVMFGAEAAVSMADDGNGSDAQAGDGIFTAVIPAAAYTANEMVRYYVTGEDTLANHSRWPLLYDQLGQDRAPEYLGTVVADPSVTSQAPRLQWFVAPDQLSGVDNAGQIGGRSSLFFDGEFYDNIFSRTRGASSLSVAKKSYKFDFPEGHYFRYADDRPRAEEINVNTTFQDKSYIRESLTYETFQLAELAASDAFNVRVERNGEFFSVATFVEQVDEIYLERHGLDTEGALYKMFNGITSSGGGVEKKTRRDEGNSDLAALVAGLSPSNPNREQYVFDNIDIPAAINYMVSGILVQDFDRGAKNFYVYRDTNGSGEWTQLPWDQDLTYGNKFYDDNISGNGSAGFGVRSHPFYGESAHQLFGTNMMIDAIIDIPETREMYLRRLRTLMDDILQSPDTPVEQRYLEGRLDELSALLADDAAADLAKWGAIYGAVRDFPTAIDLIRTNYLDQRRVHLFETHNIQNLDGGGEIISTLIPEFAPAARYYVPADDSLGDTWTGISDPANIAAWGTGQTGIGYEDAPADYAALLNTVVDPTDTCAECTSILVRIPFSISDQTALDSIVANGITLRMKYDDGFVAYINGQEVARRGVSGTPTYDTTAVNHDDGLAVTFEDINISAFTSQLAVGDNILAVHGLNQAITSSDMLILPSLIEGVLLPQSEDVAGIPNEQAGNPQIVFDPVDFDANPPSGNQDEEYVGLNNPNDAAVDISGWHLDGGIRFTFQPGTVIPAGATLYVSPNVVAFRARTEGPSGGQSLFLQGGYEGHLSSLGETVQLLAADNSVMDTLIVPPSPSDNQLYLRISELHYNPDGSDDTEFVELTNISSDTTLDLGGVTLSEGPSDPFVIPVGTTLAPGEYALVVRDQTAFSAAYPNVVVGVVMGEYAGGLSNSGEQIKLDDANGSTIVDFVYDTDGLWPARADGVGASLELIDPATTPTDQTGKHYRWRGSSEYGGSPASPGGGPVGVVINEVLTNSDDATAEVDTIELFNSTADAINIGGWFLSDSSGQLLKFEIPGGTSLGAGAYEVFDEHDFNPTPLSPGLNDFALNGAAGDDVWLVVPDGIGGIATFVDDVDFGAALTGVSLGRAPDGDGRLVPQSRTTLGCGNRHVRPSEVVISELNYNPGNPSAAALAIDPDIQAADLEFVELHNVSLAQVDLTDWRLRGGVDLDFAPGTMIGVDEIVVVVSFDPDSPTDVARTAAFRSHYGIDVSVRLIGGYTGALSNSGERVRLQRPGTPPDDDPLFVPHPVSDEVVYDDLAPWPTSADGGGSSLQRSVPSSLGNDASHWTALAPTPGSATLTGDSGDFDGDGSVTARDIDLLFDVIDAGLSLSLFDLDQTNAVGQSDVTWLVSSVLGTVPGDANLDGGADGSDFNIWNDNKFQTCGKSWAHADFDGDGAVDGSDFNVWLENRFTAAPAGAENDVGRTPRAALTTDQVMRVALDSFSFQPAVSPDSSAIARQTSDVTRVDGAMGTAMQDAIQIQRRLWVHTAERALSARPMDRSASEGLVKFTVGVADDIGAIRCAHLIDDVLAEWSSR